MTSSRGAGVAGLMLASAIAYTDKMKKIELDIYEATANLSEIGAGINLWRRAYDMLVKIGLEHDVLQLCECANENSVLAFQFRKSDQKNGHPVYHLHVNGGHVRIHRADLQRILLKRALTSGRLHLSHKLVTYTEHSDGVHLVFEDGSEVICDLLIGADGIRSTVRRLFLTSLGGTGHLDSIEPVWTGTYAYRGLVPREELVKRLPDHTVTKVPVKYMGKLKHIVSYPLAEGRFINVVAFVHDENREGTQHEGPIVTDVPRTEMLSIYNGWEPEVQALLECMPSVKKWAIHQLRPLKKYAKGRVLLLGDAAHAMSPHQGTGAGQAMEDAYVLARILLHSDIAQPAAQIPLITHVYDAVRQPIGNKALLLANTLGKLTELTDDDMELPFVQGGDEKVPHEVLEGYVKKMLGHWKWHWETSVEDECQEASRLLQKALNNGRFGKAKL
ncbi:hypothetical protein AX15_007931 [Amanita polypyramis BW_CC]|nr:hypothetical protein AX15_007931 [Amanita polypyramis BW_CC]